MPQHQAHPDPVRHRTGVLHCQRRQCAVRENQCAVLRQVIGRSGPHFFQIQRQEQLLLGSCHGNIEQPQFLAPGSVSVLLFQDSKRHGLCTGVIFRILDAESDQSLFREHRIFPAVLGGKRRFQLAQEYKGIFQSFGTVHGFYGNSVFHPCGQRSLLKIVSAVQQPVDIPQETGYSIVCRIRVLLVLFGILQQQVQIGTLSVAVLCQLHDRQKVCGIVDPANQCLQCHHAGRLPQLLQSIIQLAAFLHQNIVQLHRFGGFRYTDCHADRTVKAGLFSKHPYPHQIFRRKPEHRGKHDCRKRGVQCGIVQHTQHIQQQPHFPCF